MTIEDTEMSDFAIVCNPSHDNIQMVQGSVKGNVIIKLYGVREISALMGMLQKSLDYINREIEEYD